MLLHYVPEPDEVPAVARKARHAWGLGPASRLDIARVCRLLDIEVSFVSLDVPDGGAQGFLVPRANGRFRIEVDPEPPGGWQSVPPALRRPLARHRKRFLIAHELAHMFFYEDGPAGPQRVVFDSARQEAFCDEFARALLVPGEVAADLPFSPRSAVEIQRRFDVSMEVAVRASVAVHTDKGVAWLLLQRAGKTLVQWTSADRSLTAQALQALRTLAARACQDDSVEALAPIERAQALHLPKREQVIVTCESPGICFGG